MPQIHTKMSVQAYLPVSAYGRWRQETHKAGRLARQVKISISMFRKAPDLMLKMKSNQGNTNINIEFLVMVFDFNQNES